MRSAPRRTAHAPRSAPDASRPAPDASRSRSPRRLRRRSARLVAGGSLAAAGLLALALPASAHVTASSTDAEQGGYGKVVLRVPSESEGASTVKLTVTLPKDHPIASVSPQVRPGWKVTKTYVPLAEPVTDDGFTLTRAVSSVTWTATGAGVPAGQFDEFALSLGELPEVATVPLPAVQTYSDGSVVRWDEPTPASGAEPEHPAPTLRLARAAAEGGTTAAPAVASTAAAPRATTASAGGSDVLARVLGGAGLVLGALGLAAGLRRRRSA